MVGSLLRIRMLMWHAFIISPFNGSSINDFYSYIISLHSYTITTDISLWRLSSYFKWTFSIKLVPLSKYKIFSIFIKYTSLIWKSCIDFKCLYLNKSVAVLSMIFALTSSLCTVIPSPQIYHYEDWAHILSGLFALS